MTAAGRAYFKRKEGSNLRPPVKSARRGTKNFRRRVSFAARFSGMRGRMKDDKGRPTRLALALRAWGFRNKQSICCCIFAILYINFLETLQYASK